MDTTDVATLEGEIAAARISWQQFAVKPARVRISSKQSEVGWGGYSTVHRATLGKRWRWWVKLPIAIKKLSVPEDREGRLRVASELLQELKIWAPLNHPNIVAFRGFHISQDLKEMWLISDLATNGNLFTYLETGDHPLGERLALAKDTADGLNYLHSRTPPICHGDIKSLNILVGAKGRGLICDFGMANENEPAPSLGESTGKLRIGGTTRYSSPELFDEENRPTIASDVWSWGCLCHEIVTSLGPYHDVVMEAQVIHRISARVLPATLDQTDCPDTTRDLLRRCWRFDPRQRPMMSECLEVLRGAIIQHCRKGPSTQPKEGQNTDVNFDRLEKELNEALELLKDYNVDPSTVTFPPSGGVVGKGGYGVVVQATMTREGSTEEPVAVKKLRANGGRERRLHMVIAVIRELKVSAELSHPNVLPFLGFHVTPSLDEAWLISPLIPNGDLSLFIQQSTLSSEERMELALDTARGLEYLHGLTICHGDIKSSNVLVKGDKRAVLCDFGLAKSMESMPTGLTTTTFNEGGTLAYESPELILGQSRRSFDSDVWAWGCLLHEIFSRKPPYHWGTNPGAIIKWITTDIPPGVLAEGMFPPFVRQLLIFCWQSNAPKRPTMKQCLGVLSGDEGAWQLPDTESDRLERSMRMRLMWTELNFRKDVTLGSGVHGVVYNGTMTKQGSGAAIKVAVKGLPSTDPEEARERLFSEIRDIAADWDALRHPSILPFLGFSINPSRDPEVLLASPLVVGGNLGEYLKSMPLSYKKKMELARGVAEALLYLHTRDPPLTHGNLHSRNILMNNKGHPVLSDCGFAGMMDRTGIKPISPSDAESMSSRYWSPDVKTGAIRGVRDDVWSWGCILLEIVTGRIPYDGVESAPALVDNLNCPPRIQNLLGLCWKKDQKLRPTVSEIIAILDGRPFRYENVCKIQVRTQRAVESWKLSQDGTRLAIAYRSRVDVHSTEDGKRLLTLNLPNGCGEPVRLRFSRSWKHFVVGTSKHLLVFNLKEGKNLHYISREYGWVNDVDVSWDDALVACAVASDSTIRLSYLADVQRGHRVIVLPKQATHVALSPTPNIIAVSLIDGGLQIFNVHTGGRLAVLGGKTRPTIHSLSFSPDWLLEAGDAGVQIWDTRIFNKPNLTPTSKFHSDKSVRAISVSPYDGNGPVALIDGSRNVHVYMKYLDESDVSYTVGNLPTNMDVADVGVSTNCSGTVLASPRDLSNVLIYRFGSYDSPGTYRIDRGES